MHACMDDACMHASLMSSGIVLRHSLTCERLTTPARARRLFPAHFPPRAVSVACTDHCFDQDS